MHIKSSEKLDPAIDSDHYPQRHDFLLQEFFQEVLFLCSFPQSTCGEMEPSKPATWLTHRRVPGLLPRCLQPGTASLTTGNRGLEMERWLRNSLRRGMHHRSTITWRKTAYNFYHQSADGSGGDNPRHAPANKTSRLPSLDPAASQSSGISRKRLAYPVGSFEAESWKFLQRLAMKPCNNNWVGETSIMQNWKSE
jgi:hypothetical protein